MEIQGASSHVIGGMDDATARLILHLQDEDIEQHVRMKKGKRQADQISDNDLAMEIYRQELQDRRAVLGDRCMGRSITRATITDAAILNQSSAEEATAISDRALAHRLAGVNPPNVPVEYAQVTQYAVNTGALLRSGPLNISDQSDQAAIGDTADPEDEATTESSSWAASRPKLPTATYRDCTSCNSKICPSDSLEALCGHHYCSECLSNLFELSTTDENLFPPRCCRQSIPLWLASLHLSQDLAQRFQMKSLEFSTSDRVYCHQPRCSTFIGPKNINKEQATCPACGTLTCTICKSGIHNGDCPKDIGLQQVLDTAREQAWQRCFSCRRVVELDTGCNHMGYVLSSVSPLDIH